MPSLFIFVVGSALIVGGWVVMVWSRKYYLGLAVFLGYFKEDGTKGGSKILSFYLLVSDVYHGNEKGG